MPAETSIPLIVVEALFPLNAYILFLLIVTLVGAADEIPVTALAPVVESEKIKFPVTSEEVPEEPIVIPVITPPPVMFEIVLL